MSVERFIHDCGDSVRRFTITLIYIFIGGIIFGGLSFWRGIIYIFSAIILSLLIGVFIIDTQWFRRMITRYSWNKYLKQQRKHAQFYRDAGTSK